VGRLAIDERRQPAVADRQALVPRQRFEHAHVVVAKVAAVVLVARERQSFLGE
jgi:hypothetical protein